VQALQPHCTLLASICSAVVNTRVFEEIEVGNLQALTAENDRFRRAVVENDDASKLDNQDDVEQDTSPKVPDHR
jgi:hypothetical protein